MKLNKKNLEVQLLVEKIEQLSNKKVSFQEIKPEVQQGWTSYIEENVSEPVVNIKELEKELENYEEQLKELYNDQVTSENEVLISNLEEEIEKIKVKVENKGLIEEEVIEEIFGLSQKEKQEKQLIQDVDNAIREVNRFNFKGLFRELEQDANRVTIRLDMDDSLKQAEKNLPTVKKLLPDLFENKEALIVYYQLTPTRKLKGIVLKGFSPYIVKDLQIDNNFSKENLKKELNNLLPKK